MPIDGNIKAYRTLQDLQDLEPSRVSIVQLGLACMLAYELRKAGSDKLNFIQSLQHVDATLLAVWKLNKRYAR